MDITDYFSSPDIIFQGFFIALKHSEETWLKTTMLRHCQGKYLYSLETTTEAHQETDGQHFHFVCEMSDQQYHKFMKNVKDKYKLRGQAKDDLARQYGKIKDIKDTARLLAYCMKDGNYKTNLDDETVEKLKLITFKPTCSNQQDSKHKKSNKGWTQDTVAAILEKYPDKKWDLKDPRDMDLFENIIFKHLGKACKGFDEFVILRLSNGVYNLLPKSEQNQKEFQRQNMSKFRHNFGHYGDIIFDD